MTELEKYEVVNKCKTLKELSEAILQIAEGGVIEGRTRSFDAVTMADNCSRFTLNHYRVLTREIGIRQQAITICFQNAAVGK